MLQRTHDRFFSKLLPRRRDDRRLIILLTKHMHTFFDLFIIHHLRTADNDCRGVLNLILEKFTEVLHIHLCLFPVNHCDSSGNLNICIFFYILHRLRHIGKLTDSGRLDDNAVRLIFFDYLFQRLAEISYKRTANTSRIHLRDLNSCIL